MKQLTLTEEDLNELATPQMPVTNTSNNSLHQHNRATAADDRR